MNKLLPLACSVALLSGCSHSTPHEATLTVTPSAVKNCGANSKPIALTVRWDASTALKSGSNIKLWINGKPSKQGVSSDDDKGTLWLQGGAIGSSTTGAWMVPGARITMTNAANGNTLAHLDVPAAPCHQ